MTREIPLYRLVVFDEIDDPQGVRDLFCRVTGIHPTDAMVWVARAPGVWPKPLPASEVKTLLDGLYEYGVAAEAWRTDQFPDLVPPRTIHDAACLPDGFRIKGLRGEPTHWVPWDRIELISGGRIEAEDEFRGVRPPSWTSALTVGLNALVHRGGRLPRRTGRASRIPRDPTTELLIVRRDPRIAFRIIGHQFNYASLGDRLHTSAAENFPVFLEDLCTLATDAYLTHPTRALRGDRNSPLALFPSPQALLDYTTHRLLWSWYCRDRDKKRSAGP